MKYPIPLEALDDRLAWTGSSGTGKTHDAGTAIEKVLHAKSRACVVDPLGVWWGLRLRADGKSAGFKVAIFGGPHGDIAITETSGKLIGETVAGTKESCIIDLSEFDTDASQRRFMLAFLVALYGGLKGDLLHLVLDEADMWAPQRILDKEGDATKLHHNVQKIVRRGRVKGFIPWLITQRPAEISKSILSMMDGMVMHQAISPQDINACMDWVRPRADKATAEAIETQLPAFQRGEAVTYIPRRRILSIAQFPKKVTFDSSRSPERGEKKNRPDIALKPLDIDALKKRLEKVEAEAKANDVPTLKAENAKLKAEKAALERAKGGPDADAIARAEERGFERGKKEVGAAADQRIREARIATLNELGNRIRPLMDHLATELQAVKADKAKIATQVTFTPSPVTRDNSPGSPANPSPRSPSPVRAAGGATTARQSSPAASGDDSISPVQQRILDAVAEMEALSRRAPKRELVAIVAGYGNTRSKGFSNALSGLSSAGHVFYPDPGSVSLTESGRALAAPPTNAIGPEDVQTRAVELLGGIAGRILGHLIEVYPGGIEREELAAKSGYGNTRSKGFSNTLSKLSSLGFVTYPSPRQARAGEVLFP